MIFEHKRTSDHRFLGQRSLVFDKILCIGFYLLSCAMSISLINGMDIENFEGLNTLKFAK